MPFNDLTGQRFNRWTVGSLDPSSGKRKYWFCICDCGTEARVIGYGLTSGKSASCGCFNREQSSKKHTTHGMKKHSAYDTWCRMKKRCELPTFAGYADYGGSGIKVCEKWQTFVGFWEDMGPTWAPGLSIDRKDNFAGYEPNNCRWATPKQQANNRRDNRKLSTPKGWMNVSQAAEVFGINRNTIMRRLNDGWQKSKVLDPVQYSPRWHKPKDP